MHHNYVVEKHNPGLLIGKSNTVDNGHPLREKTYQVGWIKSPSPGECQKNSLLGVMTLLHGSKTPSLHIYIYIHICGVSFAYFVYLSIDGSLDP